jgi:hypothetical protein
MPNTGLYCLPEYDSLQNYLSILNCYELFIVRTMTCQISLLFFTFKCIYGDWVCCMTAWHVHLEGGQVLAGLAPSCQTLGSLLRSPSRWC